MIAASLAKSISGDTLHLVSNEAIQMHGGIGVTDEYDLGFFLKKSASD
jgi:alkylation response protein AidB-like acyl-CoA dehydrogenase